MINNNISYYFILTFRVRPLRGELHSFAAHDCVAPCLVPQKPHTSSRSTIGFRLNGHVAQCASRMVALLATTCAGYHSFSWIIFLSGSRIHPPVPVWRTDCLARNHIRRGQAGHAVLPFLSPRRSPLYRVCAPSQ